MEDLTRRAFLRAAGLSAAGLIGAAALLQDSAYAQEEDRQDKRKAKDEPDDSEKDRENTDQKPSEGEAEREETRACPQCGDLMYKQGDTWTCDTCGYSYVE